MKTKIMGLTTKEGIGVDYDCSNCFAVLDEEDEFCWRCGAELDTEDIAYDSEDLKKIKELEKRKEVKK